MLVQKAGKVKAKASESKFGRGQNPKSHGGSAQQIDWSALQVEFNRSDETKREFCKRKKLTWGSARNIISEGARKAYRRLRAEETQERMLQQDVDARISEFRRLTLGLKAVVDTCLVELQSIRREQTEGQGQRVMKVQTCIHGIVRATEVIAKLLTFDEENRQRTALEEYRDRLERSDEVDRRQGR